MTFTREQLMALPKEDLLFLDWQAVEFVLDFAFEVWVLHTKIATS